MDDQRGEILAPPGRSRAAAEIDSDGGERIDAPFGRMAPPRTRRSRLAPLIWLLAMAAIVAAVVWLVPRGEPTTTHGRARSTGPVPIAAAPVEKGDMPVTLTGLGTVTPLATVTVKTQISGYLIQIAFKEGQMVKKGDFLAQIDPRPYQVALEQAEGQLAKDQALLRNAQLDLQRYSTLVAQNSIAKQTRDTQSSLVAQYQAAIVSDKAAVDAQKLNLDYCRIVSPVSGRVGLRQIDAGNYVQTSDPNGIVVVTRLEPISVIFTLPEDDLRQVLKQWHAGAPLPATAYDRTGATELAAGRLETIDNQIDPTTGTVKLRALFDNRPEILFPNQFVNIRLLVETLHDAMIVPSAAIQRGAPGTFVYVVKPDHTVGVQPVKLGPGDGQRVVIRSGLEPGESVVVDGADRLRDGAKVALAGANGPEADKTTPPKGGELPQGKGRGGGRRGGQ